MNEKSSFSDISKIRQRIIKCTCGFEILVTPDTKEIGQIIELHAKEHQKTAQKPKEAEEIFNHVQDLLLKQVLKQAAKQGEKDNSKVKL